MDDPKQSRINEMKKALAERNAMVPFINTWVNPFYMEILHGNYCRLLTEEQSAVFVEQVRQALAVITPDVVTRLLSSYGWREQITGSWFCGLKGWKQFAPTIGASLVASKNCFQGQGFAFALACFGDEASAHFLTEYLDLYLPQTKLQYDQDWALAALSWIDAHQGGSRARVYLEPGGLWDRFIADSHIGWELNTIRDAFWRNMRYCEQNFAAYRDDV